MKLLPIRRLSFVLLFVALLGHVQAEVKTPAIFGSHMVLQQKVNLPVWGTAAPGEAVTVSVAGHEAKTTADSTGKWKVTLEPLTASATPVQMTVSGTNKLVFDDVLIGDVWMCSGQSNMEFGIKQAHNASEVIPKANHPGIRLFMVKKKISFTPLDDCTGEWLLCTPENIQKDGWGGFSAVAYFFGREIHETQKIPVGLIGSYWGGTPAQAWTSIEALGSKPTLTGYVESQKKTVENLDKLHEKFEKVDRPKWKESYEAWLKSGGKEYQEQVKQWQVAADAATKSGQVPPEKPTPAKPAPKEPRDPSKSPGIPACLYNGMIAPIIPYAIKGAIWYQGEANAGRAEEYRTLFPTMITDWRTRWGLGDFPFLFVQLANWAPGTTYPYQRDSQLKTLSLPNTGMAVSIDVGEEKDIHPKNKQDVGHRLALAGRHIAYGESIVYSGPIFDSLKVDGNKAIVSFKHVGGGLIIGSNPSIRLGVKPAPALDHLTGFAVAGADKQFVPAQAKIVGETVVVWNDQVAKPEAVRYGWDAFPKPTVNLYNKEGLPASPFASDDPHLEPPAKKP